MIEIWIPKKKGCHTDMIFAYINDTIRYATSRNLALSKSGKLVVVNCLQTSQHKF